MSSTPAYSTAVSSPNLVTILDPPPELIAPIRVGLGAYNTAASGANPKRPLTVLADDHGRVVGGAYGWLHYGWLVTDWLWVEEAWRGRKLGSALLAEMEARAREAGIKRARLNTASFQAPAFYQKLGYTVFAELPVNGADGRPHTDYFLRKDL